MADWQRIQSRAMVRDLGSQEERRYPVSSETERRRHLLRLQEDIDYAITDSLVSAPTDDDMDIVRHLMRQNKRVSSLLRTPGTLKCVLLIRNSY